MKSYTNTYNLFEPKNLSIIGSSVSLILLLIGLFADIPMLEFSGFLLWGCIDLFDAIRTYKSGGSLNFFSWAYVAIGFILAATCIPSMF